MTAQTEALATRVLDAKGLNCPLPILRTRKAIADMPSGDMLRVLATDPGSVNDLRSFCNQSGHALVSSREDGGVFEFLIRKS